MDNSADAAAITLKEMYDLYAICAAKYWESIYWQTGARAADSQMQ